MNEELNNRDEFEYLTSLYLSGESTLEEKEKLFSILQANSIYKIEFSEFLSLHSKIKSNPNFFVNSKPNLNLKKFTPANIVIPLVAAAILLFTLYNYFFINQLNSTPFKISQTLNYGKCILSEGNQEFSIESNSYSICQVNIATNSNYLLLLYPNSKLLGKKTNNTVSLTYLSGVVLIESQKKEKSETLILYANNKTIQFYGTKIKLDGSRNKEMHISVLEGSIRIYRKNESNDNKIQLDQGEKVILVESDLSFQKIKNSQKELKDLETIFNLLAPNSEVPDSTNLNTNKTKKDLLVEEILQKSSELKLPKITGKKVILKSGNSIVGKSIFQKEDTYLIFTDKEILFLNKEEVESIEFE